MRKALHFGAGSIGRGFIGLLLSQSGYQVVFVDIVEQLVQLLAERGRYVVRVLFDDGARDVAVENVLAIDAKEDAEVVAAITEAVLITTAVGPAALQAIAPVIARGLQRRADLAIETPLNIIACENLENNSWVLRKHVIEHLADGCSSYLERFVGFPRCVVDRLVPPATHSPGTRDPLSVVVEEEFYFVVEASGIAGEPPSVRGMQLTDKLDAYQEQKLFTLNAAHATAAYLGYLKGYEFIHEAISDLEIRQVVSGVQREVGAVLVERHDLDPSEQEQYAASIMRRWGNAALQDPVVRVAREPKRKLAAGDRLLRPAGLALASGVTPTHLATGIAAALLYNCAQDRQALELSRDLEAKGIDGVLKGVCGLDPDDRLARLIKEKLEELTRRKRALR